MAREEKKDENEKIKKLAEFKSMLEKKIAAAMVDLENFKMLLEFVNETLLEKGFKRAEIEELKPAKMPSLPPVVEYQTVFPLKAVTGDLLANLYMSRDSMRVTFAEGKRFDVKTPPFQQFLVERVLKKMQEKDSQAASKGEMAPDKIFSYEIILDGDAIREIVIENLTADRLRELKSSIRWTLEKMHEKMKKNV
ncbi:MAG: hypothetical protein NWE91_03155 [Candidatus Bathyarchaeota archaeon]|nr:hypothetical protein [Candidatus Bathyarchaeota archaeon]